MSNESIEIILIQGPDGSLSAGVPGGTTFERAGPALQRFFKTIGRTLPIVAIGEPEKHLDDRQHQLTHRLGSSHR